MALWIGAMSRPTRILLVTGLSGAGRTTVLKTLEDIGWETVDNLPLSLLDRLLSSPLPQGAPDEERPLAIGIDSRTRGFDARAILRRAGKLREEQHQPVEILFVDAADAVLAQRFSATRRRHPLAQGVNLPGLWEKSYYHWIHKLPVWLPNITFEKWWDAAKAAKIGSRS